MTQAKYFARLLNVAAPEDGHVQDAIEYAIITDNLKLTYKLEQDLESIGRQINVILASYHHYLNRVVYPALDPIMKELAA